MSTEQATQTNSNPFRFAVSATFTADPLRPVLQFWGRQLDGNFEVRFAPYNQLTQTLIDPHGEFGLNTHGINVMLARLEDFGNSLEKIEENLCRLIQDLRSAGEHLTLPLLFVLCPSSPVFKGQGEFASRMRNLISTGLQDSSGLYSLDFCDVQNLYSVDVIHDAEGERLGNIPYTEAYFCALGTSIVRFTHALMRPPFKVVALDCDNTLWQGICGEDGPEGVKLTPGHAGLQKFMTEQRDSGMLLTLASKNNEPDVIETFRVHPEMPLAMRHFVAWRLNWQPKSDNLVELAEQLSLGLDSFIFVDDNPKECAELQQALPEVLTLALPPNAADMPRFLSHVWAFDRAVVTEEDRNRSAYYSQSQEFGSEIRKAASLEEFMRSLDLRVSISPLVPEKLSRVAQLTQRTNQFNTTTIRRSEGEIRALAEDGLECYSVDVSDRFGDYGLVGVLITQSAAAHLTVETFLLSCRALGRGVEHRMLAFLGQNARARGLRAVEVQFKPTAKNLPARQFLETVRPESVRQHGELQTFCIPAGEAAEFKWQPAPSPNPTIAPAKRRKAAKASRVVDYERIARCLATVPQILGEMRAASGTTAVEGMSETEAKLAQIWADLLERPSVKLTDNFFDVGGHSLLAVLLLLRIRETFGVELSIDDVYSGTLTLADLAARVEAAQLGDMDPEEYASLLAEIESLSDEQARELLAREHGESA